MNGGESFLLSAQPGRDHILVSRFHAPDGGEIRVVINDALTLERTLPAIPGQFVEIPTLIPAGQMMADTLHIRVESVSGTLIFPYRHWLYAGDFEASQPPEAPIAFQDGAIVLSTSASVDDSALAVDLNWWTDGTSTGDLIAFVHLYSDLNAPPVSQSDLRPGRGALPPGAWLPGVRSDRIVLDLGNLPSGIYTLAVGLYDAVTFERLEPALASAAPPDYAVDSGRILIDVIQIADR